MRQSYKHGVTMIELLVVIAIIGILSVVSVVALSKAKSSRQVRVVADEIKDKILDARSFAVAPTELGASDQTVTTVRITLTKKAGNVDNKASIKIDEMNGANSAHTISNKKYPDNIDFKFSPITTPIGAPSTVIPGYTPPNNTASFSFSAGQRGYIGQVLNSSNAPVPNFAFIVQNTSGTENYQLNIDRFGYITIIKQ